MSSSHQQQVKTGIHDPVCGMKVDPNTALHARVKGKTYYFCSQSCLNKFQATPHAYLEKQPGPAPKPQGGIYTCPMHPEIEALHPGACPKCGMALEPKTIVAGEEEDTSELRDMDNRFRLSLMFTVPLLVVSMGDMLSGGAVSRLLAEPIRQWLELLLATPIVVYGGMPFFQRALSSVKRLSFNMFTLIGLGVFVSYGFSLLATVMPGIFPAAFRDVHGQVQVYFEASGVIVTLVLLGQVLELRARHSTGSAIRSLLDLVPKTARRLQGDREEEVLAADLMPGDRVHIRPGEKIPVDGTVLEGHSSVDEAMISGEPIAIEKKAGSVLVGGTLNRTGTMIMTVEKVGADTMLAQIVAMVSQAQRSRAPIQRLADRVSAYFVPAVIAAAIITFVIWAVAGPAPAMVYALVNAVAVLMIACPCALGLATPMSIMVASGKGAQAGVLFKNAQAIEGLQKIDTLFIDKTGTLTEGRPTFQEIKTFNDFSSKDLLRWAASVENQSEHPLAQAIVEAAQAHAMALPACKDFQAQPGLGVAGKVEGHNVVMGTENYLTKAGVDTAQGRDAFSVMGHRGQTVMWLAVDNRLAGLLAVVDPVKAGAREALAALRQQGLTIIMISGDQETTARAVAGQLGITEVMAQVLPQDKADRVKALQQQNRRVAMAGDGINDAPALAQANIGIAMGTGTDVAMESAQVTLLRGDLWGLVKAFTLSRKTIKNIKQNLFFAFIYNALGIPLAAGALYPLWGLLLNPMIAAAAMSFSSVSVIGNALRLRYVKLNYPVTTQGDEVYEKDQ